MGQLCNSRMNDLMSTDMIGMPVATVRPIGDHDVGAELPHQGLERINSLLPRLHECARVIRRRRSRHPRVPPAAHTAQDTGAMVNTIHAQDPERVLELPITKTTQHVGFVSNEALHRLPNDLTLLPQRARDHTNISAAPGQVR